MKRIWDFSFARQMDEQLAILRNYADLLSVDTDGKFTGEVIISLSGLSLWVINSLNTKYRAKFFEILRNEQDIYPAELISSVNGVRSSFANSTELEKLLVQYIESESVQKALANLQTYTNLR